MKTTIQLNGKEFITEIPHGRSALQIIKGLVKANGMEWKDTGIFVPNFPEKSRYLIKSPGFQNLVAGG